MPASVPISFHEKKWLVKIIQDVYGIQVIDAYSCQKLSEELERKAKISISYNTLRRLFGIIKGPTNASRFTLDSLCKGMGYTDFTAFQQAVNQFEKDFFNEMLILNRLGNRKDDQIILGIVQQFQMKTWDEVYQFKSIIDLCLEVKNFDLLTQIFEIPFDTKSEDVTWRLYVSFQSIYVQSCQNNEAVINYVAELLKTNELAQRILLQLFVEEDGLQGYYGKWLLATSEDLVEDMPVFKNLMLCQLAFELRDIPGAQRHLALSKQSFQEGMHPNLKGRIAAWDYILESKSETVFHFYKGLQDFSSKLSLLVFFYRLLEVYQQDISQFDLIEDFVVDDLLINFSFPEKHNLNKLYLLKARYFILKGNKVQARAAMNQINLLYIYSCDKGWVNQQVAIIEAAC
ncbi:hypothetical protein G9H58_09420 [Aquirufa antheringensis]|uniref:hypothetical protein n=1 Tax=Aquirufa antheringensis TaxID=2516559 RepID=UPI0022A8CD2B|nr:hypothetical protein [Aquirufa antheringensis]MCZ2478284.1 hypothetical protein [Aquirufa antheringensis]